LACLIAERRKERAGRTFEEVASDFLRDTQAKQKRRTFENYELALKVHAIPILGKRKLANVTRSDVAAIHRSMSARPYAANALLRVISAMWSWAVKEGEVEERPSPCRGITRYAEHHRERFLTPGEFQPSWRCPARNRHRSICRRRYSIVGSDRRKVA
jgi:hypothetical protein